MLNQLLLACMTYRMPLLWLINPVVDRHSIMAKPTTSVIDNRKVDMESHALKRRDYMSDPPGDWRMNTGPQRLILPHSLRRF